MGCQRKISRLLIIFLIGLFWWMSENMPSMASESSQNRSEQNDISRWIAELESSLPSSGDNKKSDETEDFTTSKSGEIYGNDFSTMYFAC